MNTTIKQIAASALLLMSLNTTSLATSQMYQDTRGLHEAKGQRFMIVSQGEATTKAAKDILARGGNIFDAAAAASFMLAVERPQSTGLGGGGFALIRHAKDRILTSLDFREQAPALANKLMFTDPSGAVVPGRSVDGALASGVPGMVAGVLLMHERFGKLPRAEVLKPAIELAEKGFIVYPHLAAAIADRQKYLAKDPEALTIFFHSRSPEAPLKLGDKLIQANLGKTLRLIAKEGRGGFYQGLVAQAISDEEKRLGGLITAADLAAYRVKERPPLTADIGPFKVITMGPPSSGGVHIIQMLRYLEPDFSRLSQGPLDASTVHTTVTAMQIAFHDRAEYLGDPDFVNVPTSELISSTYADQWRRFLKSKSDRAIHLAADEGPRPTFAKEPNGAATSPSHHESQETTHFTIADSEGNIVASTQTINGWFGSGVLIPGTGIIMNNEMDDFAAAPGVPNKFGVTGGEQNAVTPHKRPLSSMSPTVILRDDLPVLALGSPSGSQIITCVTLTLLNRLVYKMPLWQAVTAQRYHHQWRPETLSFEPPGTEAKLRSELEHLGYRVQEGNIGCKVQAISFEGHTLVGVSDPRGEGMAASEENARTPTGPHQKPKATRD